MNHIVALSGGKDSTAMALRLMEVEPKNYQFCITPTGRELPEMRQHWEKIEQLLGKHLLQIPAPSFLDLAKQYQALPNWRMRWCTRQIKIEPFMVYVESVKPAVCYVGIRADEVGERDGTNWKGVEGVTQDFPLTRWGWDMAKVKHYLREKNVEIPQRTDCDVCFFQRIAEWWRLWKYHPERFREGIALETWTGHTLRTEGKDSWAVSLSDLGKQFEKGFTPKGADQLEMPLDVATRDTMCAWCAR